MLKEIKVTPYKTVMNNVEESISAELETVPAPGSEVKVYFWNNGLVPFLTQIP